MIGLIIETYYRIRIKRLERSIKKLDQEILKKDLGRLIWEEGTKSIGNYTYIGSS